MMSTVLILVVVCIALISSTYAYLPGVAPHNFKNGEDVQLKVNKLR
jgi:hypothetical protein